LCGRSRRFGDWRFLQISGHKARHIVDEPCRLFVAKSFAGTHDGGMGERFDRGYTHERRKIRVGNIELISVRLEISANQPVSLAFDGLDVFKLAGPRRLLDQNTMQFWIDAVGFDHDRNQFARRGFDWAGRHLDQRLANQPKHLVHMKVDDGRDQRLLGREMLTPATVAILLVLVLS
jgi:hypothetical protein